MHFLQQDSRYDWVYGRPGVTRSHRVNRVATLRETRLLCLVNAIACNQLVTQGLEWRDGIHDQFGGEAKNIDIFGVVCLHHLAERFAFLCWQRGDLVCVDSVDS